MKKATSIFITIIVSSLLILVLATMLPKTYAGTPAEPHNADAMWVEPTSVVFSPANATVGTKFNLTVAMNITQNVFTYSIGMKYDRTTLKVNKAGFTEPPTSNYMTGHSTTASGPIIDTSYLQNGSILASESCSGMDFVPGPRNGTLIWVEFEFVQVPTPGQTLPFNISRYVNQDDTSVKDEELNPITIIAYDGAYPIVPELLALALPALFASSALAVILGKAMSKKKTM
jgi:hypothetical protein